MKVDYDKTLNLIQELKKYRTLGRIFVSYGPIDTLKLAISRLLNNDVYNYFEEFLEDLDKTIVFFNNSRYKVNIDRYTLGELYNTTRLDSETSEEFFIKVFDTLNLIVLEIIKAGIDEAYDNGAPLKGISSLRNITKINYRSEHFDHLSNVITNYYITIANKPFNIINILSYLKRYRLNTYFISSTVIALEKEVISYIRTKYSVSGTSVYSVIPQNS